MSIYITKQGIIKSDSNKLYEHYCDYECPCLVDWVWMFASNRRLCKLTDMLLETRYFDKEVKLLRCLECLNITDNLEISND